MADQKNVVEEEEQGLKWEPCKQNMSTKIKVLFVCLRNICRSPAAEILFFKNLKKLKKETYFELDSCGIGGWHEGEMADIRIRKTALLCGLDIKHIARKIRSEDFKNYDYLLAMDYQNIVDLKSIRGCIERKIFLLSDLSIDYKSQIIPDPYFGDMKGFENVFNLLDKVTEQVANTILLKH